MSDKPYITREVTNEIREYNPEYGDDRRCQCGHTYGRHFDTYDAMYPCGCKYCGCYTFNEATGKTDLTFQQLAKTPAFQEIVDKIDNAIDHAGLEYEIIRPEVYKRCRWLITDSLLTAEQLYGPKVRGQLIDVFELDILGFTKVVDDGDGFVNDKDFID